MNDINPSSRPSIKDIVERLAAQETTPNVQPPRRHKEPLPSHTAVKEIIDLSRALLFPAFFGDPDVNSDNILYFTGLWTEKLFNTLSKQILAGVAMEFDGSFIDYDVLEATARSKAEAYIARLPELRRLISLDVRATYLGDPAAISTSEVLYCYPGIRAILNHRIAHELLTLEVPIIPRMISEQAHSETGIDIHPAATIGESFTIDHGTGIVIGATARIGNNVKIYQGVTLGAKSFDLDKDGNPVKGEPRHPIIGNDVIIYSNASILGRITIGDGAVIGGNIWVTEDVAPGERLIQAKANANNVVRLKQ